MKTQLNPSNSIKIVRIYSTNLYQNAVYSGKYCRISEHLMSRA